MLEARKYGAAEGWRESAFRLSREERDYVAGHALDSINDLSRKLTAASEPCEREAARIRAGSGVARKIAALSNLLSDIGWEREGLNDPLCTGWILGELFPVAQLRPWLEEWQRQDHEALIEAERALEVYQLERRPHQRTAGGDAGRRNAIADAQTKLGTGAILLARIEKWMASRGN